MCSYEWSPRAKRSARTVFKREQVAKERRIQLKQRAISQRKTERNPRAEITKRFQRAARRGTTKNCLIDAKTDFSTFCVICRQISLFVDGVTNS